MGWIKPYYSNRFNFIQFYSVDLIRNLRNELTKWLTLRLSIESAVERLNLYYVFVSFIFKWAGLNHITRIDSISFNSIRFNFIHLIWFKVAFKHWIGSWTIEFVLRICWLHFQMGCFVLGKNSWSEMNEINEINEIKGTLFRRLGADCTKALRKATPSTRKAKEASAHSAPRSFFLELMSASTRDTDELMIPLSSFKRTGSPMFKRSVVSASDVDVWPPLIWHSAVNNCFMQINGPLAFYHPLNEMKWCFVSDQMSICLQTIEFHWLIGARGICESTAWKPSVTEDSPFAALPCCSTTCV